MAREFRDVDARDLRVPASRSSGPDLLKLHRQIAQYGTSTVGMPPLWVYEAADGVLVVYNGVTRAARVAMLAPGKTVQVEVIGSLKRAHANSPRIGDLVP